MVELASELLISFELPSTGFQNVLKIAVSPALVDQILDTVTESLHDLLEELPGGAVEHHQNVCAELLEALRTEAKAHLESWEGKLVEAQERKVKGDKAVQNLRQMREAYYKELSSYRQQLYLKSKAEANGEKFHPESVIHFDPAEYLDDELGVVLSQKVELMEHKHAAETRRLRAQIDSLTEQVKTKAFFLNAKDELVTRYKEDIFRRDSCNSEEDVSRLIDELQGQHSHQQQRDNQSEDTTDPSDDVDCILREVSKPTTQFPKGRQRFVARRRPDMAEACVGTDAGPALVDAFTQSDVSGELLDKAEELCAKDAEAAWQRLLDCQDPDKDSESESVASQEVEKMDNVDTTQTTQTTDDVPGSAPDFLALLRKRGGEDGVNSLTEEALQCLPGLAAELGMGDCDLDAMSELQASFGQQSITHKHMAPMLLGSDDPKSDDGSGSVAMSIGAPMPNARESGRPEQRTVGVQVEADLIFSTVERSLESELIDPSKMTVAQLLHRHSVKNASPCQPKRRPRTLQTMVKKTQNNDSDFDDDDLPVNPFNRQQSDPVRGMTAVRRASAPQILAATRHKEHPRGQHEAHSLDNLPDMPDRALSNLSVTSGRINSTSTLGAAGPVNSVMSHGSNNPSSSCPIHSGHSSYSNLAAASGPGQKGELPTSPAAHFSKRRSLSNVSIGSNTLTTGPPDCEEARDASRPGSAACSVACSVTQGNGRSCNPSHEPCQPRTPEGVGRPGIRRRTIVALPQAPATARASTSPLEETATRRMSRGSVGSAADSVLSLGDNSPTGANNGSLIKPPPGRPAETKRRPSMEGSEVLTMTMPMPTGRRSLVRRVQSENTTESLRPTAEKGRHHHRPSIANRTNSEILPPVCTPNAS